MPYFIGIAGESGVGKSTLADIVSLYFGANNTLKLSTDDLHKWGRSSPMWDQYTHLNPLANNLGMGDAHIAALSRGEAIARRRYNHNTGLFDPPTLLNPKPFIINEGLHAFFTDTLDDLIDLKIFVDTDDFLRIHWKLIRDVEQRGYTPEEVMRTVKRRREDNKRIRDIQMERADVVINLSTSGIMHLGDKNESLVLSVSFDCRRNAYEHSTLLFYFIERFFEDMSSFVNSCQAIGSNLELCQNSGGNVSVKMGNRMVIKSSGVELKHVSWLNGHSIVDEKMEVCLGGRPSMEAGAHALLWADKYVVHTHPIYLNTILCLYGSKAIVNELFRDIGFGYIKYCNPGSELLSAMSGQETKKIYFLENHGLIVGSDDHQEAIDRTIEINNRAKQYLKTKIAGFESFSLRFADPPKTEVFFSPDSALFLREEDSPAVGILAANNYIARTGRKAGTLRALSDANLVAIREMDEEKYRKQVS